MKQDVMKEALKRRKGMGIDLTIIVGKPGDDESMNPDSKELAPEVKDANSNMQQVDESNDLLNTSAAQDPDEAQDKELIRKMLGEHEQEEDDTSSLVGKARALMRSKIKKS